jgi:serine/threonine protein kinase
MPLQVFFSYAQKDEALRDSLETHLTALIRRGIIQAWHDRKVAPGANWHDSIDEQLTKSSLILLLVSADFLASDYCYGVEIQRAMEMRRRGEAQVIPIILRACDWDLPPLAGLAALPTGGKAVTSWANQDEAWIDVVRGIREALAQQSEPPLHEIRAPKIAPDEIVEQLEAALARKQALAQSGFDVAEVEHEIRALRRRIREGRPLKPGAKLGAGRYLLAERLGQGGFGVVWKARDLKLDRLVAVKVLHNNLAGDALRIDRFFRGARAMETLHHPAVVRVLEPRGEDSGHLFFVMELMTGGDLRQAVLQKKIGPEAILPILLRIGEALAIAHARGVVHRDIKPANILLADDGTPRLTDFDLVAAADTTGGTRTGALGTWLFAAPECLDRPQEADARADVFGLGMTAIFGLYGADLPMDVLRAPERFIGDLRCEPANRAVKDVLKRAVEWRREERFKDAGELCDWLQEAMSTSEIGEAAHANLLGDEQDVRSPGQDPIDFLVIDTRPILGTNGTVRRLNYKDHPTVSDLLNRIWGLLQTHIDPFTYNEVWVLRDAKTGKRLTDLKGTQRVRAHRLHAGLREPEPHMRDSRSLEAAEIQPGMILETILLK